MLVVLRGGGLGEAVRGEGDATWGEDAAADGETLDCGDAASDGALDGDAPTTSPLAGDATADGEPSADGTPSGEIAGLAMLVARGEGEAAALD